MRRRRWLPAALLALTTTAFGQAPTTSDTVASGQSQSAFEAAYGAPGHFGMAYGTASYGLTASFPVFSSPYGAGYGYGYAPSTLLPGAYGVGLWRPGLAASYSLSNVAFYRTFPVPYQPVPNPPPPPVGAYAPALGPSLSGYPW